MPNFKRIYFVILCLAFTACMTTTEEEVLISETTSTVPPTSISKAEDQPEITLTTIAEVISEECTPDNNQNINFSSLKNVQEFLNKYGFNAGEVDGYLGNQTIAAIKQFQTFAGLYPDGDVGPKTIKAMNRWTGCEEKSSIVATTTTTSPLSETDSESSESQTSTTTTSTTLAQNISNKIEKFGYMPSVSLVTNEINTVLKSFSNQQSVCGTPYYENLDAGVINLYSNGIVDSKIFNGNKFKISTSTTEIISSSGNEFKILVDGNGDENYSFYFIEPFTAQLIKVSPIAVSVSPGRTEASFSKNGLKEGYWFYSFAENLSGEIVKSSGLRELLVGEEINQNVDNQDGIESIFLTSDNKNLTFNQVLDKSQIIEISYLTDQSFNLLDNTATSISIQDEEITLTNATQANVNEVLLIERELMLVIGKNDNKYRVQRGFLNTIPNNYSTGLNVKKIKEINDQNIISSFAYAVLRTEKGLKFQVPLFSEMQENIFNLEGCPNGSYSLEQVTTFSWRPKGSSVVNTSTNRNVNTALFNKQFVINSSFNYSHPSFRGIESATGNFVNDGPRNKNIDKGDKVKFSFNGIKTNSSHVDFVKMNFQMIPLDNSKKSKTKSILFDVIDNNFNFEINFEMIIDSESQSNTAWEKGYKYIFKSLELFDRYSKTTIQNNGQIVYGSNLEPTTHDAYYLDQFIFNISSN